jgi:hypothetical protein
MVPQKLVSKKVKSKQVSFSSKMQPLCDGKLGQTQNIEKQQLHASL